MLPVYCFRRMDEEDPRVIRAKALIGELFTSMMKRHHVSEYKLEKRASDAEFKGVSNRSYLKEIKDGIANPTIGALAGLASLCGEDFEDFLNRLPSAEAPPGKRVADLSPLHKVLYSIFAEILKYSTNAQLETLKGTLLVFRDSALAGKARPQNAKELRERTPRKVRTRITQEQEGNTLPKEKKKRSDSKG